MTKWQLPAFELKDIKYCGGCPALFEDPESGFPICQAKEFIQPLLYKNMVIRPESCPLIPAEQTCAACKWWDINMQIPGYGLCEKQEVYNSTNEATGEYTFREDFGCRFHEKKGD